MMQPEAWEAGAEQKPPSTYNFKNHVQRYLRPIRPYISREMNAIIETLFPDILNAFFAIAPRRKNFISYAYVIGLILREYGYDTAGIPIPVLKTPSKIREACEFWAQIKLKIGFRVVSPVARSGGDHKSRVA
jgi:hypothetical protein